MTSFCGVILDVDGTLVDSNHAHALAWQEALAQNGFDVPLEMITPLIGMGADKLLPAAVGLEAESEIGKQISKRRGKIFKSKYLPTITAFPRTQDLLKRMKTEGLKLAVASSAEKDELEPLLKVAGAEGLIEEKASSDDAENSKPDPDIINAALRLLGCPQEQVVMLADTQYDVEAAKKAGIPMIALRSGGRSDAQLKGALGIYDDSADLLKHFDQSPLGKSTPR